MGDPSHGVQPPGLGPSAGQAHVEVRRGQFRLARALRQRCEGLLEGLLYLLFELVGALAKLAPPVPRQLRHQLQEQGELAVRPHELRVGRAQRGFVGCGGECLRIGTRNR